MDALWAQAQCLEAGSNLRTKQAVDPNHRIRISRSRKDVMGRSTVSRIRRVTARKNSGREGLRSV